MTEEKEAKKEDKKAEKSEKPEKAEKSKKAEKSDKPEKSEEPKKVKSGKPQILKVTKMTPGQVEEALAKTGQHMGGHYSRHGLKLLERKRELAAARAADDLKKAA